jgi:hypothetical protein
VAVGSGRRVNFCKEQLYRLRISSSDGGRELIQIFTDKTAGSAVYLAVAQLRKIP